MFPFNLDPEWILAYRNDTLTSIFKVFPYLSRDYIFFPIIGLGYWLRPQKKVFSDLGFIVPLVTIMNYALKNLFAIPRPPSTLYLITMEQSYGFPSGDSMLATVFWGMIFVSTQSRLLRLFCVTFVGCIMVSRVYLGVHSIFDVFGGAFFGLLIVYLDVRSSVQETKSISERFIETPFLYWLFYFILFIGIVKTGGAPFPPMIPLSLGALLGYGLSLSQIGKNIHQPEREGGSSLPVREYLTYVSWTKWMSIAFSLFLIGMIYIGAPIPNEPVWSFLVRFMKSALIVYLIFSALPRAQRWYYAHS